MDKDLIQKLIELGSTEEGIAKAQVIAKKAMQDAGLDDWPHNGCAANLSALLKLSGIDVPMTLGAGKLASRLGGLFNSRGWIHVPKGGQQPGDIGVAYDTAPPAGSDHVYLVIKVNGKDQMMVSDNQDTKIHNRTASGSGKFTETEYFLRAPGG